MVGGQKGLLEPPGLHGGKSVLGIYGSEVRDGGDLLSTTPCGKPGKGSSGFAGGSKSSGSTDSRKERKQATSVSSSSSCNSTPASSSTDGSTKIGAEVRAARAMASLGRDDTLISSPPVEHQVSEIDPVAQRGHQDVVDGGPGASTTALRKVVGHRALRFPRPPGQRRWRGFTGSDEDRQVTVPADLAQQHDRRIGGKFDANSHGKSTGMLSGDMPASLTRHREHSLGKRPRVLLKRSEIHHRP